MLKVKMMAAINTGSAVAMAYTIANIQPAETLTDNGINPPKYNTALVGQNVRASNEPSTSAPKPPFLDSFSPEKLKPIFGSLIR